MGPSACISLFFASTALVGLPSAIAAEIRGISAASSQTETVLMNLEVLRANAILRRDGIALRNLMDRYYRHVDSRGRVRSKTDLLKALERGDLRFEQYKNESTEIQVLDSGKTAVVAGVFISRQIGSKLFRGRYVRIWVSGRGGWKNTFHQATEMKTETSGYKCN